MLINQKAILNMNALPAIGLVAITTKGAKIVLNSYYKDIVLLSIARPHIILSMFLSHRFVAHAIQTADTI